MKCSVVIATWNKSWALSRTLETIRSQKASFEYEVIVVDDGSTDDTPDVCDFFGADRIYLDRPGIRGPAEAVNAGYKRARAPIIVCMNDDVVLQSDGVLERMCWLSPRSYNVGAVWDLEEDGEIRREQVPVCGSVPRGCVGLNIPRLPIFCLAAVPRKDVYGIGGRDEDFRKLNYEDIFMADCLIRGHGLRVEWRLDCVAHHLWHERDPKRWAGDDFEEMRALYRDKVRRATETGEWVASGGPWPYEET